MGKSKGRGGRPPNAIADQVARDNPDLVWESRGGRHYLLSAENLDRVPLASEAYLYRVSEIVQEGSRVIKNRRGGGTGR